MQLTRQRLLENVKVAERLKVIELEDEKNAEKLQADELEERQRQFDQNDFDMHGEHFQLSEQDIDTFGGEDFFDDEDSAMFAELAAESAGNGRRKQKQRPEKGSKRKLKGKKGKRVLLG